MDWTIWGTKLVGSLRSLAVLLAKLLISESGSARKAVKNRGLNLRKKGRSEREKETAPRGFQVKASL